MLIPWRRPISTFAEVHGFRTYSDCETRRLDALLPVAGTPNVRLRTLSGVSQPAGW